MIARFICNYRFILLSVGVLFIAGLGALKSLPRMEDPRVINRFATFLVAFPGATAERVEALVTRKLENKLKEVAEIALIVSDSRPNGAVVTIELDDAINNPEPVFSVIRDKVKDIAADFPAEVLPPKFEDQAFAALTWIGALQWRGAGEPDLNLLARYSHELENRLRNLMGTEYVETFGLPEEEIIVDVDPVKLTSMGLNLQDVARAVEGADAKVAAGQLEHARYHWQIEVAGKLDTVDRIQYIPLAISSDRHYAGFITRLGDVASVHRGLKEPQPEQAIIYGKQAVVVGARMQPTIRVDRWTLTVEDLIENFRHELPENIIIDPLFNQTQYTETRLHDLVMSIAVGFIVVIVVLLLTLGLASAIVVALSLPLTVAFTLFCMQLHGLEIHQISVTGLVVALGIVVDNAIVFSDAISRYRAEGLSVKSAVSKALYHYWVPLGGSTITTILAFMPVVLMPGPVGEFVGPLALTVIYSLVGSYLISHTIVVGLAGRFSAAPKSSTSMWYDTGVYSRTVKYGFINSMRWSLAHPKTLCALIVMLAAVGFASAQLLTESFFPPADRNMFHIEVYNYPGSSLKDTRELTERISSAVFNHENLAAEDITSLHWFIGNSAPKFYYNMSSGNDGMPHYAQAMVTTTDFRAANRLIPVLQEKLDKYFTQAQIFVRKLEQGPPYDAPVELRLFGENLHTLRDIGEQLRAFLASTPYVLHTKSTLSPATPKITVQINEAKASLAGLSPREVAQQLGSALTGEIRGAVLEDTQEIPVRVRVPTEDRASLETIFAHSLGSAQLTSTQDIADLSLTIDNLGDYKVVPSRSNISRRNGVRINTVQAFIDSSVLPSTVLQSLESTLSAENFMLPPGYRMEIAGESAERDESVKELETYVSVIVALLVIVLVLSFNSFRLAGLLFIVAAFSACMGIFCVFLAQFSFGFIVIFALMGLMGLAINGAIVILSELRKSDCACRGNKTAIIEGVSSCSRHILSTTLTTVGGFMPLILGGGTFWPPFAIAIAGGTLFTTLLSLYFVPSAFFLMARKQKFEPNDQEIYDVP
ncbi:efflux RND transporter permease subunit [uncultured Microbulbifer sp.]|uniref:efflux RND transporter permease subunit n=1 Tax=uncultured Microbulbifer sp. TaxID=348147 RepID=UPI002606E0D7|nr:efflux RND transporter permease subunit [uncultured Microbulbifer sp.]